MRRLVRRHSRRTRNSVSSSARLRIELITAEKFVGKVIFYLWNDVFKNNGFEGPIFKDVDGTELSFAKFYKSDMKGNAIVQKDKVELFLNNLGVEEFMDGNIPSEEPEENEDGNQTSSPSTGRDYTKFSINGCR